MANDKVDVLTERNVKDYAKNIIEDVNGKTLYIKTDKIGTFKSRQWEFQKESRFIINSQPANASIDPFFGDMQEMLIHNKEISDKELFIKLKLDMFQDSEIILGPKSDGQDLLIVESLIKTYCTNFKGEIKRSCFKIR